MLPVSTKTRSKPRRRPPILCGACGKPITGNWTIGAWFTCGAPRERDVVHVGCRNVRIPLAVRQARQATRRAA